MRLIQSRSIIEHSFQSQIDYRMNGGTKPIVVLLEGDPGLGKTATMHQIKEALNIDLLIFSLAQYDPAEVAGWVVSTDDGMTRLRPDWFPVNTPEMQAKADAGQIVGAVFIDEIKNATVAGMNLAAQFVDEFRIGKHHLPDGWVIVAASNKDSNRAGTNRMPTHLRDRFMTVEVEADVDDFVAYANANDFDPLITGFIRSRPELLSKFERDALACPSPRGWDKTNTILSWGLDPVLELAAIGCQIGEGVAAEFAGYRRIAGSVVEPREVFASPSTARVPEDPAACYAVASALAFHANLDNFGAILTYLSRFTYREFAVVCVKDACARNPELKTSPKTRPALKDFLVKNGSDLMKDWDDA